MNKTEKLAAHIIRSMKEGIDEKMISNLIAWHWDDATKVVKNINETSLGSNDRFKRIVQFEIEFGLSKTHIL